MLYPDRSQKIWCNINWSLLLKWDPMKCELAIVKCNLYWEWGNPRHSWVWAYVRGWALWFGWDPQEKSKTMLFLPDGFSKKKKNKRKRKKKKKKKKKSTRESTKFVVSSLNEVEEGGLLELPFVCPSFHPFDFSLTHCLNSNATEAFFS